MIRFRFAWILLAAAMPCCAQEATPAPKPVKVCVAQIRNQTPSKMEVKQLRQSLMSTLEASPSAKSGTITFLTIEADSADTAKDELQKAGCDYATYIRVLRKPTTVGPATSLDTGTTIMVAKRPREEMELYGLQCTVESASTGMPVLIDRQFETRLGTAETVVPKLLTAEAGKIESALVKKLAK